MGNGFKIFPINVSFHVNLCLADIPSRSRIKAMLIWSIKGNTLNVSPEKVLQDVRFFPCKPLTQYLSIRYLLRGVIFKPINSTTHYCTFSLRLDFVVPLSAAIAQSKL